MKDPASWTRHDLHQLSELESSFHGDGPEMTPAFWDAMFALGGALIAVWESGACPDLDLAD